MRFSLAAAIILSFQVLASDAGAQEYVGDLVWKALPDGRNMELTQDFSFKDAQDRTWSVPKGTVVDGASIPSILWSFVGGPFAGKYRNASVIHDHFVDLRSRPWKQVHQVFYDGMLASGVNALKAKIMYLAVYRFGPRWDFIMPLCQPGAVCEVFSFRAVEVFTPEFAEEEYQKIRQSVEQDPDIPISAMERQLDRAFLMDAFKNAD